MSKNNYISNSARLLSIGAAILFIANVITFLAAVSPWFSENYAVVCAKAPNLAFYSFSIIAFIAFNGEGVGYKRSREAKKKKVTVAFKWYTAFVFAFMFFKTALIRKVSATDVASSSGVLARIGLSVLMTVLSFSFLLFFASLWYLKRDKNKKILASAETAALVLSAVYSVYRVMNYITVGYGVASFGGFGELFSSEMLTHVLCLVQYAAVIIMLALIKVKYADLAAIDEENDEKTKKELINVNSLYENEQYGLDARDDRWGTSVDNDDAFADSDGGATD